MRPAFTLILLFISISIYAQHDFRSGYIVKANGDSLTGWVAYPTSKNSSKVCIYKATEKGGSVRFSPKELLVYGIYEDKRFESKTVITADNSNLSFLEVLVKGNLSLYLINNIFYYERDTLVELPSVRRSGKLYVGLLNLVLDECNLRADDTGYEQRDLINLVQNYNRCLGGAGLVYKSNLPWKKVNYQIMGGITLANMQMENYGNVSFNSNTGGFIGAGVDISMPRKNEKIFLSMELSYYNSLFQGYQESLQSISTRSDVIIDMSLLKFPLGVRYIFLNDYNTPYLKGGVAAALNVGSSYKIITEQESSGTVTTSVANDNIDARVQMGFWMSAGYQRGLKDRYKIFVETRVEKMYGYFYGQFQTPVDNTNFNMVIGLRY